MNIERVFSASAAAMRAADLVAVAVRGKRDLVAALPTGRTPIALYAELARRRATGELDLGALMSFNLDEVLLPRSDPRTFFQFMARHAWDALGIAPSRRLIPDSEATDPTAECARYEELIRSSGGGLDIAILGVGADGHIAYNLPGQIADRTHVVDLDDATIATLGAAPVNAPTSGLRAITMGLRTILDARTVVLLATGAHKAQALARLARGARPRDWPVVALRDHPALTVIADEAAASQL